MQQDQHHARARSSAPALKTTDRH